MMKNKITECCIIVLLILISQFIFSVNAKQGYPNNISSGNYGKGFRYNIQGWTYIHLEGDPYERGYQYGYLAASEITDMIYRWMNLGHNVKAMKIFIIKNLPRNYDKLSQFWWNICRLKSMRYFEKHIPNEYKQEIKGMVAGLNDRNAKIFGRNIDYMDIVASQFVQEVDYAFFRHFNKRRFQPLRDLIFGLNNLLNKKNYQEEQGHCRAIIATGDATEDGAIVAAHETIFFEYIAQRCNFIVDVKPSSGYRFIMTAPPGSLWSQEDFYENEIGIILTETELIPQGPFNIRKTPKGIRSRTAIQYSKNIDEVINNLQKGNSGLIPNEWLIGDTKTGEIARLEQAYYKTPITRTKNGLFFSSSVPNSDIVERELWGLLPKSIAIRIYKDNNKYTSKAVKKFKEIESDYYGKLNIENLKDLLATVPISSSATDCKITSTKLLENMGLVLYFGKINGSEYVPSRQEREKFKGITNLPTSGWLEIYDSKFENTGLRPKKSYNLDQKSKVLWTYENNEQLYSPDISKAGDLIVCTSCGRVPTYDAKTGKKLWDFKFERDIKHLVISDNYYLIGTDKGLFKLKNDNGEILWSQPVGQITSNPIIKGNSLIAGFEDGNIHGFEIETGDIEWSYKFSNKPYISKEKQDIICISAGKSCFGFNIDAKDVIWEVETEKIISASPKMGSSKVFIGSWDGKLYAIDYKTGEIKWIYQTGWAIDSTPDISDEMVFVGSLDGTLYALDKDNGQLQWYFTCKSAIHSNPNGYGDNVFFGCDDGRLYSLNKTNGELEWSFTPKYYIDNDANNYITTPIISDPIIDDGIVYFSVEETIYALDAQTFEMKDMPNTEKNDNILLIITIFISLIILITGTALLYNKKNKNIR